jgi:DNA-binding NarL/FixJ family response regulator
MITVLIVDDNPVIRMGLNSLLEDEPDIKLVGEASSGAEAVVRIGESSPDVVLMDMHMPGMDGLQATAEIIRIRPETRVLIITALEDPSALTQALAAGAKGCLIYSHFAPEELAEAIRSVASGEEAVVSSAVALAMLDPTSSDPSKKQPLDHLSVQYSLTSRELDILNFIAEGKSNPEIAEALCISGKTVKNHINSIYSKLHVKSRYEVIRLRLKHQI